jgi:CRISPR-associated endonuclease/helicase Cas3
LGREWARLFRLPAEHAARLSPHLVASAAFHDWGKASSSFDDQLKHGKAAVIRHEHLSSLLLGLKPVHEWLGTRPDLDRDLILSAVLTHHLKARDAEAVAPFPPDGVLQRRTTVFAEHGDFKELLARIAERLHLTGPLPGVDRSWGFGGAPNARSVEEVRKDITRRLSNHERRMRQDEGLKRLTWAVRAGLIAADAAASGLFRTGRDFRSWLAAAFDEKQVCTGDLICREIVTKRVAQLAQQGKWEGFTDFQLDCAKLSSRALLLAPCGSGKTLAAWLWIAARLQERPAARVIFLYPTRATATEGFRDYISWAPEADAALMHGTAEYDLQGMFETTGDEALVDEREGRTFRVDRRLFALGFWERRIFSATVDQFLAFMQYAYGPVCMLPVLADSVVVFVEVHSFDRSMFSALKELLNNFDVPVLCMTATLTEERTQDLVRDCKLSPADRPAALQALAAAPRYRLRRLNKAEAENVPVRIRAAIAAKRRVLWVVNTVKRAQAAWRCMKADWPAEVPLLCYHSRFKLVDRRDRHQAVMDAFQGQTGPVLAITTSVCEMSLDLDADVLATEDCPISSLIQRMGRANRSRKPRSDAGEVWVYPPVDDKPYERRALTGLEKFLDDLKSNSETNDCRQSDLEEALRKHGPTLEDPDRWCSFVGSGPYAQSGEESFRELDDFTAPAILCSDVGPFLALQANRQPTAGLVVPVPRRIHRAAPRDPRLPCHLPVAPDENYDPLTGFWEEALPLEGGEA